MDIRVLRYFLTVAREGSITGAAKFLHVTQPTLSRQLQDLEDELGKKLFVRSNHNVTLTDEGMLLRRRAEDIVDMMEKTTAEFNTMDNTISGDVYIGGGESDVMRFIAQVATDLQSRYPHIRYHMYSGNSDDVTERLDKGLLDFGILIQPADLSKYNYINLPATDVWGLLMRKDHPLAQKDSIRPADLRDIPLILSRQAIKQTLSRNEFTEWFGDEFDKLNIVATINLIYNATLMVEAGFGCVFSLDKLVRISSDSILCFRPLEPKLESELNFIWKKYQMFSPAADLFLKEVQTSFSTQEW